MLRKVMVDNLKTEGILLPKGCDVSLLSFSIQSDSYHFEEPFKFDPFRYSRIREASITSSAHSEKEACDAKVPAPTLSFVSTGSQFLPFGHGKHACPGRYLVDFELTMVLAYILLNYEIEFPEEYNGKRLLVRWMAEALMPPDHAKIRVRRRAERDT